MKVCTVRANSATRAFRSHLHAIEDNLQDIAKRIFLSRKLETVPEGYRAESQGIDAYMRRETEESKESFKRERRPSDLDNNEIY